jgi:hypothetical protein
MKRFTLFLTIAVVMGAATGLHGQLTVNIAGSSTGGSVATTVTAPPSNQTVLLGSSLTLTVAATGANLTYQWQKGGVDILNATSATYTKASATTNDAGTYTVLVHGDCGTDVTPTAVTVVVKGVKLSLKLVLEGAYDSGSGLMNDALRSGGYLATTSPYASVFTSKDDVTTSANPSVFMTTGSNAVVDWLFIELRSKTNPATVLATRSALLRRDGAVVDVDGTSSLLFNALPDNYYIAVRHRNHLAFRLNTPMALSVNSTPIDFTDPSVNTGGLYSRKTVGSIQAMYAGDANHDGSIDALDRNAYLRPQFGMVGANKEADFNLDASVDALDLNLFFRINYGVFNDID